MVVREDFVTASDSVGLYLKVVGEGTPDVLVPGLPGEEDYLGALTESHTIAFFHPRGRGLSQALPNYGCVGLEQELGDLATIHDALGGGRLALIGGSYLGATVALYAARHAQRVTRVVQNCPMPPRRFDHWAPESEEVKAYHRDQEARVDPEDLRRLRAAMEAGLDRSDPATFSRLANRVNLARRMGSRTREAMSRLRYDPGAFENEWTASVQRWFRAFFEDLGDYDWRPQIATLEVPTLVIHGSEDGPEESRREWCRRPNARLLVLHGIGHIPELEAPDLFIPAVESFLAGNWPDGSVEVAQAA